MAGTQLPIFFSNYVTRSTLKFDGFEFFFHCFRKTDSIVRLIFFLHQSKLNIFVIKIRKKLPTRKNRG